jgi:hypothetical protein
VVYKNSLVFPARMVSTDINLKMMGFLYVKSRFSCLAHVRPRRGQKPCQAGEDK